MTAHINIKKKRHKPMTEKKKKNIYIYVYIYSYNVKCQLNKPKDNGATRIRAFYIQRQ